MRLLFLPILLFFLHSCSVENPQQSAQTGKIKVVCTTSMLGDMAKAVGGNLVEVEVLMGPGVDPHLYKASQGDVEKLTACDVIVYNGLHLEGKMAGVLEKTARNKKAFVAANALIQNEILQLEGAADPHIWFDVSLWEKVCKSMQTSFAEAYPQHANQFAANAEKYQSELAELHKWAMTEIGMLAPENRKLVTAHDAFGYFGRAYQLDVHALQGISTSAEFGLKDLSDLVKFICEEKVPAIFIESSISDRSMKAVQEGCA
jgi:manganese/zinc/iron transport system substrate-binding protein